MELSETLHKSFEGKQPTFEELFDYLMFGHLTTNVNFDAYEMIRIMTCFRKFIQKSLELKHLVPVKDGEVLDAPEKVPHWKIEENAPKLKTYQQAREQVIYEGFEFFKKGKINGKDYGYALDHVINNFGKGARSFWYIESFENLPSPIILASEMEGLPITLQWWKECLQEN